MHTFTHTHKYILTLIVIVTDKHFCLCNIFAYLDQATVLKTYHFGSLAYQENSNHKVNELPQVCMSAINRAT
jgi:hypothetical protein